MRRFFMYTVLFAFLIYWGITFLYVAPKNYVSDAIFQENIIGSYLLGQNWKLFVPPPLDNKKIYYTFYKKGSNENFTVEVLENLLKLKAHNSPFNATESMEDYFLSGSASSIIWYMKHYEENKIDPQNENSDGFSEKEKLDFIRSSYYFQILKSFSVSVAKQHNIPINDYKVSFSLVRMEIPKFEDREKLMDKNFIVPEQVLFESEKFEILP